MAEKSSIFDGMYQTKSARFDADSRLRFEHKLAHYSMMSMSVYIILLSTSEKFLGFSITEYDDFISFGLTAFLIGIASFEANSDRPKEAYLLHQNAMEINALLKQKEHMPEEELINKYNEIIANCQHNHADIDRHWHRVFNNHLVFKQRAGSLFLWFLYAIIHYGIYCFTILSPVAIWIGYKLFQ